MLPMEAQSPLKYGFTQETLGFVAPDSSYQDHLYIYSSTITFGTVEGKLHDDHVEDVLKTFDKNLRTLFAHNGQKGIYHIVDYSDLPLPSLKIKRLSKEYFDRWFNEGILAHQAILGLPAPYRTIAKLFATLNPNIKRTLHSDWQEALHHVMGLNPYEEQYQAPQTVHHPVLGMMTPFEPGCFQSQTGQGSIEIYQVREGIFYTSAQGSLDEEDIDRYIQAQLLIPQSFQFPIYRLINNSPELKDISLASRKKLSHFVKSDNYPFQHVWLIAQGLPKIAIHVFRNLSPRLKERVIPVNDIQEALSRIESNYQAQSLEAITFQGRTLEEQLQDAKSQIHELKTTRSRNIDHLTQILGVIGWEEVAQDFDLPEDIETNPYQDLYGTLKLIQKDIKELQLERQHYLQEVLEQKQIAEDAAKSKSDFLSTMSHEIRTPMNAIIGLTEILKHEDPLPHQDEHLETLQFSARNLLSLINNILDYNKLEASKVILEQTPFHLKQLVTTLTRSLDPLASEKGLKLNINIDPLLKNSQLVSDPTRLSQILINLMSNAIKFTHQGEVGLQIISQEEHTNLHRIQFIVSDTGIGIPEADIHKIWGHFTQVDTSHTRKYGGSGLGLAITHKLIQSFGSEIQVDSIPNIGTKFSFSISFNTSEEHLQRAKVYKSDIGDELKDTSVLVVDDNKINLKVAKRHLEHLGMQVQVALSGAEAIQLVQQHDFEFILMDIQMPEMDGFETTLNIHKINPQLKILALTADIFPEIKAQVEASEMLAYLTKPIKKVELYNELLHLKESP